MKSGCTQNTGVYDTLCVCVFGINVKLSHILQYLVTYSWS
jgi:hypothetical protein